MLTRDSVVKAAKDVIFQELEGEAILLNMRTEIYFGLDAMGTRIWQLLKEHGAVGAVEKVLLDEYDVAEDDLRTHLLDFVDKLHSKGLVEIRRS